MAREIKTWREYTRDAHFREVFQSGSRFIEVKPEVQASIRETVKTHFDMLAEKDELKRLVESGEITTDDEVLAYFDKSISKQVAIIARKKEHDFQKSLAMTPKEKEKAVAVRNLTRAVFKKAIEKVTSKDEDWADTRAVLKLYEQGVGPGREGVLAKLIAEEKETRGKVDLQRYVPKVVD